MGAVAGAGADSMRLCSSLSKQSKSWSDQQEAGVARRTRIVQSAPATAPSELPDQSDLGVQLVAELLLTVS